MIQDQRATRVCRNAKSLSNLAVTGNRGDPGITDIKVLYDDLPPLANKWAINCGIISCPAGYYLINGGHHILNNAVTDGDDSKSGSLSLFDKVVASYPRDVDTWQVCVKDTAQPTRVYVECIKLDQPITVTGYPM